MTHSHSGNEKLTRADYIPVTCLCKTCKRLFVEWFASCDTAGKTKLWRPRMDCDECFCRRVPADRADTVREQFYNRSQQMFERFPHATLMYLDSVHQGLFKRKLAGLSVGTIDDTFSHKNQAIRNRT